MTQTQLLKFLKENSPLKKDIAEKLIGYGKHEKTLLRKRLITITNNLITV